MGGGEGERGQLFSALGIGEGVRVGVCAVRLPLSFRVREGRDEKAPSPPPPGKGEGGGEGGGAAVTPSSSIGRFSDFRS